MKTIETSRLKLIPCSIPLLNAAIESNERLGQLLGVKVPDNWTAFGVAAMKYALERLKENDDHNSWLTYFPIHRKHNQLIGSGGYKGKPNNEGIVEIGYEIAPDYRSRGLATEMTIALVGHAFQKEDVVAILAHTLAGKNASGAVLTKCGFTMRSELNDPDDGLIWKWEIKRSSWQK